MRAIRGELTPEVSEIVGDQEPAKAEAIPVRSYRRLMEHVAQLSYANKDHLLFFRGQGTDYKNKAGASSFYPSIYRGEVVQFIRDHGREEKYFQAAYIYLYLEGHKYWTMGSPLDQTVLINRADE